MKRLILLTVLIMAANALSDHSAWDEFKVKYYKEYEIVEDKLRFQIFKKTLRKIEQHNVKYEKGEVSYFLAINKFADYTEKELETLLKPRAADITEHRNTIGTLVPTLNDDLPESIDWREKGVVTEVKDQQMVWCASSWAFSAAGALEGQLAIQKNQHVNLSAQELVDCEDGSAGCDAGYVTWAFLYVQDEGLSSEEQYPYVASTGDCINITDKVLAPIQGHVELIPTEEILTEAVATIGPVSVGINLTDDWLFYGGGIYDNDECSTDFPNHYVLAVGYDTEDKDYWIFKNSFGKDWGEDGYFRLVRGKNQCNVNLANSYPVLEILYI